VPHYVGTLCKIPDHYKSDGHLESPTTEFAVHFYTSLANGLSVGESLATARQDFFSAPGVPLWAYYVHYGNPSDKFVEKPILQHFVSMHHKRSVVQHPEFTVESEEAFVGRFAELGQLRTILEKMVEGKSSILL